MAEDRRLKISIEMDNFPDQCDLIETLMDNVSPSLDCRSVVILIVPWEVVVNRLAVQHSSIPKGIISLAYALTSS